MHKLSFHLYEKIYKDKMQHKVTSKGVLHNQPLKKVSICPRIYNMNCSKICLRKLNRLYHLLKNRYFIPRVEHYFDLYLVLIVNTRHMRARAYI